MEDKIRGCIIGAMVGDALGARYEFLSGHQAKTMLKKDYKDNHLPMLGGGPFSIAPGQLTDDSELMLSLLNAIIEANGTYNRDIVAKYYIAWYKSDPFDIGKTTKSAFKLSLNYDNICSVSHLLNMKSKSNGCLMRCMPLGILSIKDLGLASELAELDTRMTNPNKDCINIVMIYNTLIAMTILNYSKTDIYSRILSMANTENKRIIRNSLLQPLYSINGEYMRPDGTMSGFYGISIQNALYHFFNNNHFEKAMYDTISLGGDTDTNCCILGGILGACYGLTSIPNYYVNTVFSLTSPNYNRHKKLPIANPDNIADAIDKLVILMLAKLT